MLRLCLLLLLGLAVLISAIGYSLYTPDFFNAVTAGGPQASKLFSPYGFIPVIDPGHGGFDPGTSAESGIDEKDLNLRIGLKTDLFMRFLGLKTVMTRDSDISLHDPGAVSIRERNASDKENRVKLINSVEGGVLISIHQNHFDQRQYYGAQVLYNGSENLLFAGIMQEALRLNLDVENTRKITQRSNLYLLNNSEKPAVLIECGFLSNTKEAALLSTDEYQVKVAMAITKGFLEWSTKEQ
jgi:N-acetylmuramoyl-L-alanine amidase